MKKLRNFSYLTSQMKGIINSNSIPNSTWNRSRVKETNMKTIILWTRFFGEINYIKPADHGCPNINCVFTSNRDQLLSASAVVFHARDLNANDLPNYRSAKQRWILLNHEAPPQLSNFNYLNSLINWTATYMIDSDILLTPIFKRISRTKTLEQVSDTQIFQKKSKYIAWFVSNCKTASRREDFVNELNKYVAVDVFGDCGLNKCLPKLSVKCYEAIGSKYWYYLAFENSFCKDYVTEKLFNILPYNIIPVVFGGADYGTILPNNSYIDAQSFKTPLDLADYLINLSKDEKKYMSYFWWKNQYQYYIEGYACQICRKLNANEPNKFWNNIQDWFFDKSNCKFWTKNGLKSYIKVNKNI